MKKNIPHLPLLLCAALAHTVHAQTWWWTGESSIHWSDTNNWANGSMAGAKPLSKDDLQNASVRFIETAAAPWTHLPSNQNIEGLVLDRIIVGLNGTLDAPRALVRPVHIRGEAFTFNAYADDYGAGSSTVAFVISNDVAVAANGGTWTVRRPLRFYGKVAESGGSKRLNTTGNTGPLAFHNQMGFTGGLHIGGTFNVNFHGMETTGGTLPASSAPAFFTANDTNGPFNFNKPEGAAE